MKILIKNIKGLAGHTSPISLLKGAQLSELPVLENAFLAIEDGRILTSGSMDDWGGIDDWRGLEVIDAEGKFVLPAFCDSHTHLVYAASRESEFEDRIRGLSYEEIAAKGGGILNSALKLASMDEDELFKRTMLRAREIIASGTGAVEIKSGYGLSTEAELKMLHVARRIGRETDLTVKTTFLGAHAIPAEYKKDRSKYIDLIIHEMLPAVADENLADFVDVFCEKNYFSPEETLRIIEAGKKYGLQPKIHVNQFNKMQAIPDLIKAGAVSVDHLEVMDEQDLAALEQSDCIATVLPSCSFFLGLPYAPAGEMLKRNIAVAIASDFNPGTTPSGNVPFLLSLACIKMKLTPQQAINATTINGAAAMGLADSCGSFAAGKLANLIITKEMSSLAFMPYSFGSNLIETVILKGKIQQQNAV